MPRRTGTKYERHDRMRSRALLLAACCAFGASSAANAQTERRESYFAEPVPAPARAIEVGVESHFAQGAGLSAQGIRATDLSREGIGFGLTAGYRASPKLMLGLRAQYDEFASGELTDNGNTRGVVAGPLVAWHFAPDARIDPWWSGGAGYRTLWLVGETPGHDEVWRGFEIVRMVIGVDFRVSEHVAFGPFFGGDVTVFTSRHVQGIGEEAIQGKGAETFLEAGLQMRFDLSPTPASAPQRGAGGTSARSTQHSRRARSL
jgi:hypothetical protein